MIEIVETDWNNPDPWWRMLHCMLVRANNLSGEIHYYTHHNKKPETAENYKGMQRAYADAAMEVACRLDRSLQVFVDTSPDAREGHEYKVRRLTGEDRRRLM